MQTGTDLANPHKLWSDKNYQKLVPWLIPLVTVCVMSLFIMPRRAIGLSSDDGLFLTLSWQVANGFGLDHLALPQTPNYLVNAVFMGLGFHEIFWFRFLNVFLCALSSLALFTALKKDETPGYVTPVAVAASSGIYLYTIQGPNSLALNFFMLGLAAFIAGHAQADRRRTRWLVVSGLLLALAGFMHVVVAAALTAWIVFSMALGYRSRVVLLVYVVCSAILWGWYIHAVGPSIFFAAPKAHSGDTFHLLGRLLSILRYYGEIALFSLCCLIALGAVVKLNRIGIFLCACLAAFFVYHLCDYVYHTIHLDEPIQLGPAFLWHGKYLLSDEGLWISALPGAFAFHVLIAAFLYYCLSPWQGAWLFRKRQGNDAAARRPARRDRDLVIAAAGIVTLQLATSVGSNTGISQGMIFFAGPACGLAIMLLCGAGEDRSAFDRVAHKGFCALCLGTIALFSLFYDHTENQRIFSRGIAPISVSPLRGLWAHPQYSSAMSKLIDAYEKNGCANKRMMAMDYVPLLNYVVRHPFDAAVGLVRPLFFFSNEKILSEFNKGESWCVIDVTSIETRAYIDRTGTDPRSDVRNWLEQHSHVTEKMETEGLVDLSDMAFYVVK